MAVSCHEFMIINNVLPLVSKNPHLKFTIHTMFNIKNYKNRSSMATELNKVHRPPWRQWEKFPGLFPVINQYTQNSLHDSIHWTCLKLKQIVDECQDHINGESKPYWNVCVCQKSRVTVACYLVVAFYYTVEWKEK